MPELPEVETVRKYLSIGIKGKKIEKVNIIDKRITSLSKLDLKLLNGQKIIDIDRKGKYLIFIFEDYIMLSHLRMEGKYYLYHENEENSKYARVIFNLNENLKLIYDDVRRFGKMQLFKKENFDIHIALPNLGNEPFDYDKETFFKIIHKQKKEIKTLLLDQSIIAGIGNIYADEILFKAKISPFKCGFELSKQDTDNILFYAIETLNEAILLGGSTIRSYHPSRDINGRFQQQLLAYGREKKPCLICNHKMIKRFLHGRSLTYCPNCQHVGKVVAIYGKIASGKSSILKMFQNDNYPCFSSDDEVDKLYKNDINFTLKCVNLFHEECLNSNNKVSKEYVKQVIIQDSQKKKELEGIIHPIIQKKAIDFIKKNIDKELIILEIPLLFEAKMESIADYIVGVDVSDYMQIQNLKTRNSISITNDLILNKNNSFNKNIAKCDFVIENNSTLEDLKKKYEELKNFLINV